MAELTDRFDKALVFARRRHQSQKRKGTEVPYIAHLLATASLVLEAGGDEDLAIGGLLHDCLEDSKYTGATFEELVREFGLRVANIVRACSDTEEAEKPAWRFRKQRYLDALPTHDADALLVSSADKLHNARSILSDYRQLGEELWERFNEDSDQLWYYRQLADTYVRLRTPLAEELERTVMALEAEVASRRR